MSAFLFLGRFVVDGSRGIIIVLNIVLNVVLTDSKHILKVSFDRESTFGSTN